MKTTLLKNPNFRRLILGKLVSMLGSNIMQFALSLYVLSQTGSAALFASMISISIIPRLLFSPFAGVLSDRFDRKKIIVSLDLLSGLVMFLAGLYWIYEGQSLTIFAIYVIIIALEIIEIFFHAAMSAVLPSIIEKKDYLAANSYQTIVLNIGQLLAPVLAAFLYTFTDMLWILWINAGCFVLSSLSELFIQMPPHVKSDEKMSWRIFIDDTKAGFQLIKQEKSISSMISLATIINFCIAPLFSVGLIFVIKQVLMVSDFQFGFYQMAISLSMIITPMFAVGIIQKYKISTVFYRSFMSLGFIILLLSAILLPITRAWVNNSQYTFYAILVLSFLTGMTVSIANLANATIFQKVVPLSMMGRTTSVLTLLVTIFVPIGQMIFGVLYDIMDASIVMMVAAMILIVAVYLHKNRLNHMNLEETTKA